MLTPIVVTGGNFTINIPNPTALNAVVRTFIINSLDDAQEVASVPVFTSFNTSEQTPFINFSPTSSTFESGLYPSNLPDSGSVAGTRRDFEDVVVIVNPANAEAAKVQLYGVISRATTGRNFIQTTLTFRTMLAVASAGGAVTAGTYQFIVVKLTTLKNAN